MANNYFPTSYQEFIHLSRYSRWLPDKERRETWNETVARYFDFFTEHLKDLHEFKLTKEQFDLVQDNLEIFGDTPTGRSQVIKVVPESKWWRHSVTI